MNSASSLCPKCGAALPATATEGLCPRCLLAQLGDFSLPEWMETESAGAADDAASGREGNEFGDYELLEEIGQGGMGVVYRARQVSLNRPAAVKVIKLGMDTRQVVARFEAERQALARMDHPNIARVFDAGATDNGRPYFAMELVRGIKITEYCRRHGLATRQRLELFIQVCQAVQHAHQKGIIHRDLKPSNILVMETEQGGSAPAGCPKIIDFGIAKAVEGRLTEETLFTAMDQFLGTPAYMSPEQTMLTSADIDTRTDIYSLGVLLYELLSGYTPFDTKALLASGLDEMCRTIREIQPARPSTRLTQKAKESGSRMASAQLSIDPDLDWIVMKCLEKDRRRRYETANGLAMDVQRYLNHEPIVARPPSRLYEFQKTVRRHWVGFGATAAVVIALSAGVLISLREARVANSAKDDALAAVKRADERLHESLLAQARASRLRGQPHLARESIKAAAELKPNSETRDEAIAVLAMSGLGAVRTLSSLPLSYEFPDFSQDLSLCAHADGRAVIVNRTSDGKEIARFEIPGKTIWRVDLSEDGRYLAALGRQGHVWLFDVQEQQEIPFRTAQDTQGGAWIEFGPAGRMLAVLDEFPRLRMFSVPSGELLATAPVERSQMARFHPDGKQIALVSESKVKVMDWATGEILHERVFPASIRGLTWHPGGTGIAVSLETDDILVWDITQNSTRIIPARGSAYQMAFSHKGDMMVNGAYPSQVWSVGPFRLLSSTLGGVGMKFGPDDTSLAFFRTSFGVGVWDVVRSEVCFTLPDLAEKANNGAGLVFSPDGRYLGLTTETEFQIWDWRENRMVDAKPSERAHTLIFHPSEPAVLVTDFNGVHRYGLRYAPDGSLAGLGDDEPLANLPRDRFYRSSITPNGGLLAIANPTMTLVYDLVRRKTVRRLNTRNVTEVKISPDGRQVVTSTYRGDGTKVWDVATGKQIRQISQEDGHTSFSPDGRWLAYGTANRLEVWKTSGWTRRLARVFPTDLVTGFSPKFSPDGRFLAVIAMYKPALLLDPGTGEELGRLTLPIPISTFSAAFSPDGSLLALDGPDGTCMWDLAGLEKELSAWGLSWGRQRGSSR